MRAAIFDRHGGPDVVHTGEVPDPHPGPAEVRIAVRASAMNHLDLWVRRGLPIKTTMPHVGGADIAGVVDAVGDGVPPELEGLRVVVDPSLEYDTFDGTSRGPDFPSRSLRLVGEHTDGGFAEYACVPAANLLQVPDDVRWADAAAAGLVSVTAWRGLVRRAGLRAGERLLVTGASGGVSTMAVQIGRLLGATVHAVTSGPRNVARVRELGAAHVYDRREGDWVGPLKDATEGRGVDVVLDSVGEAMWESALRSLAVGGRLVAYGATTGASGTVGIRHVFWKQLSILGTTMGTPAEFRRVMDLVFRGRLEPVVHEVLPLDQARRAHEMLEGGEVFGKLVLEP